MATVSIVVKHQGKKYDVDVDTSSTGETLKYQLYSLTGVEPERQKVLVKGGQLKDDTDLAKLGLKAGQQVMMMGTAAEKSTALERPQQQTRFLEDMTEEEMAKSEGAIPAGLENLGNTCYMNSTLQTLKAIPELLEELETYKPGNSVGRGFGESVDAPTVDLAASLRDLYRLMGRTQESFMPLAFLHALRTIFPQFAQKARDGNHYAQQDAEEAWSLIVNELRRKMKGREESTSGNQSFIDKYIAGKFNTSTECDEEEAKSKGETAVTGSEEFFKLDCHITKETNHLRTGIEEGLVEKIEKRSPTLERDAIYTKTSRIARLPKYLPVHFVRFFWRRDINKKTKIMRKVTFPFELDVVEFCTDELRKSLIPVRDKIREVQKEEEDGQRARKRAKRVDESNDKEQSSASTESKDKASTSKSKANDKSATADGDTEMGDAETYKTDAEIEAERAASLLKAKQELLALVDPTLKQDVGANQTGLYELRGVITHQGASADSGHYTSYVKKEGARDPTTGKRKEEDGKWWWFNDDKVTEVSSDKIETLSGGGESHSALVLLYRAVELPELTDDENKASQ